MLRRFALSRSVVLPLLGGLLLGGVPLTGAGAAPAHGIAMHGDLKYPAGFPHFNYVNPQAPKGGTLREAALGTYDSLNPFIVKGNPAGAATLPFETLMVSSADEPSSEYGLIAETIDVAADHRSVTFTLRPQARFHDGSAITADDVVFSFDILRAKGTPNYRAYYAAVSKVEKLDAHKVRFVLADPDNHELPLILGQLPVLSKVWYSKHPFEETTLEPPLGSGPYKITGVESGRSLTLSRVKDYWGKDLPVNRGQYNFDTLRFDYYRDSTVALEAFKGGALDVRHENEAKKWATGYDFPARSDGRVKLNAFPHQRPTGMQGFALNLRRPLFHDARVRRALALAFDFEWSNQNLFYGQYSRDQSYFSNSELASSGLPDAEELKLLEPLRGQIPDSVFTTPFTLPVNKSPDDLRTALREASRLLREAGYEVKDGTLVSAKTGAPLTFEVLLFQPTWERIILPYFENLKKLGITPTIRTVDSAQYKSRTDSYDFDVVVQSWGASMSPGNELRDFYGSAAADQPGSMNLLGLKSKAVDALIEQVVTAPDRKTLVTRVHALDRVLLAGNYVVPNWHIGTDRIAWWDKFGMPGTVPMHGANVLSLWWADPAKAGLKQP